MARNSNKKQEKRKGKMDDVDIYADIHESPYFKIRAIVSLLRPRFLQVLSTPDFQKCQAAGEIQEGMKLVMEYYRQMVTGGNIEKSPHQFAAAGKNQGRQNVNQKAKQGTKETVDKRLLPPIPSEMTLDSYIVGSSLTGWNFITFRNRKPPRYYGVTKKKHRSNRRKQ